MHRGGAHKAYKYHNYLVRLIKNDLDYCNTRSLCFDYEEEEQENLTDDHEKTLSTRIRSDLIEILKPFPTFLICIIILVYGS